MEPVGCVARLGHCASYRTLQSVPDLSVRPCNNMSLVIVFCQNPLQVSEQCQTGSKERPSQEHSSRKERRITWNYLSCLVLPCLALSCLVLPCLALSCLVLPCLALSCLQMYISELLRQSLLCTNAQGRVSLQCLNCTTQGGEHCCKRHADDSIKVSRRSH